MPLTLLLPKENLYADGFIIPISDSVQILKRNKLKYFGKNPDDIVHPVIESEHIWNIAYRYYGNSKWWYVITDANDIENPFELPVGESILIPDLNTVIAGR